VNSEISEKVKEIKREFRVMMNGVTAQSMRDKGLNYKLNWGAMLPRLREMAEEIGKDYNLAIALWKEDVRECKILATMIMPPDEVLPEVIEIWMEQTPNLEIAEQAAFNLYQYLPFAAEIAFQWIASSADLPQICGYHVLSRLFTNKHEPNELAINEFLDQAMCALQSTNVSVRKAAMQSVLHFSNLGLLYQRISHSAVRSIGLDFV
jgi:hypothetical protein